MKRIEIEVNKSLPCHFDATVDNGKITINAYKVDKVDDKVSLETVATIDLPTNDIEAAYKMVEHYRWVFGKLLKAIGENKPELQKELGVPVVAEAVVEQPVDQAA